MHTNGTAHGLVVVIVFSETITFIRYIILIRLEGVWNSAFFIRISLIDLEFGFALNTKHASNYSYLDEICWLK